VSTRHYRQKYTEPKEVYGKLLPCSAEFISPFQLQLQDSCVANGREKEKTERKENPANPEAWRDEKL
jgi:hypothetical protein